MRIYNELLELRNAETRMAEAMESIRASAELIATYNYGEGYAQKEIAELETTVGDLTIIDYDQTYYVFGGAATESTINAWVEERWPSRCVRYTTAGGIEFDFPVAGEGQK